MSRAMGIRIVAATQSPSEQAFGGKGTDARQQYGTRIGLPVNEPTPINMIFGTGAYGQGWRLDELDLPGKTMVSSERYSEPREGRCYWINEQQIHATSLEHALVDDDPAEGVRPHPQPEPDPEPPTPPSPTPGGGGGRPVLRAVPTFPDGYRIPENRVALWEALQKAGPEGLTKPQMVAAGLAGHGTSLQAPLSQWAAKGWVDDSGKRGQAKVYVFTAAAHTPSTEAPATDEESPSCPASL
ncbi:hypothetical protein [Streptomyces pristinaespiralis]|uniref:hypothetical protein n=1 Tax=Streptomyces pristinaespiralis TaxID=38300 RepID=UPI0033C72B3E